jgi:hypothetical protein
MKTFMTLALGLTLLASCGKDTAFPTANEPESGVALSSSLTNSNYQQINEGFFKPYCLRCHAGKYSPNISTYALVIQNLDTIQSSVLVDKTMPIGKKPTDAQLAQLKEWIDAGAPQ